MFPFVGKDFADSVESGCECLSEVFLYDLKEIFKNFLTRSSRQLFPRDSKILTIRKRNENEYVRTFEEEFQ